MIYTLKFKRESKESGYWYTSIIAEDLEKAIEQTKKKIEREKIVNAKLIETVIKEKILWKEE